MDVIKSKGGSALDSALKKISEPRELLKLFIATARLYDDEDSVNNELMKAITLQLAKYYQDEGL